MVKTNVMKTHALLLFLHLFGTTVWVGGMFFVHVCLRPAAMATLDPSLRLTLWQGVFSRFFRWVEISLALILASGFGMFFRGGSMQVPPSWHIMMGLGLVMTAVFASILMGPYKAFRNAMAAGDISAAAAAQGRIRTRVLVNLVLGIVVIAVATLGLAV